MSPPRNTRTGDVLEQMVLPALRMGGYEVTRGVKIGTRFGVSDHRIDALAKDTDNRLHLVSMKWQQTSGTAEQKIPFEVISLVDMLMQDNRFSTAHLVLGGDGWRYKDFYIKGGLSPFIKNAHLVKICSLDQFVTLANQGQL